MVGVVPRLQSGKRESHSTEPGTWWTEFLLLVAFMPQRGQALRCSRCRLVRRASDTFGGMEVVHCLLVTLSVAGGSVFESVPSVGCTSTLKKFCHLHKVH